MESNVTNEIYLDNAATTPVDKAAAMAAWNVMCEDYGNPSSVHSKGIQASHALKKARKHITDALGYEKNDGRLIFTSCATEASNTAFFSAYKLYSRNKDNIVISDSEHPSVENCAKALEKEGVKVFRIPTTGGKLDSDYAKSVINDKTFLVSCMLVNNETGAIYDIKSLGKIKQQNAPDAIFHIDAVQGFLKIPTQIASFDADFVSLSGHKLYAPKGIGALYAKKGVRVNPYIIGGGQEEALRSGTENIAGAVAFAEAVRIIGSDGGYLKKLRELNVALRENLKQLCPNVLINSGTQDFANHIVSISVPGIRSEIMLRFLSDKGIYVSAGSACSSSHADNRVLTSFGLDDRRADSTLRVSFSHYNTTEQVRKFCEALAMGEKTLIKTL